MEGMRIQLRAYFVAISIVLWVLGILTDSTPVLIIGWVLIILSIILICIILVASGADITIKDFLYENIGV